jgi:hypothetical protein
MNIATGYVFEQVTAHSLRQSFEEAEIRPNFELVFRGIKGHCDFLVLNHRAKSALVVECKALRAYTSQEAAEQKLWVDNYGFLTQLSLYMAAVSELLPSYKVEGEWRVWAKRIDRSYIIGYPGSLSDAVSVANDAVAKFRQYEEAVKLFEAGYFQEAARFLIRHTEELPIKLPKSGYYVGSCSLHFSPWSALIVDEQGKFVTNLEEHLTLLLRAAKLRDKEDEARLEDLLTKASKEK